MAATNIPPTPQSPVSLSPSNPVQACSSPLDTPPPPLPPLQPTPPTSNSIPFDPIDKLFPYQRPHLEGLLNIFSPANSRGLDASDTGTGKTYVSAALCRLLDLNPFVICPKAVLSTWSRVLQEFQIQPLGLTNYEKLHNCRYYPDTTLNQPQTCPYLRRIQVNSNHPCATEVYHHSFQWSQPQALPANAILIFDEAHRCKNLRTVNSVLLFAAAQLPSIRILLLSATISDKPENFHLAGHVLNLYNHLRHARNFLANATQHEGLSGLHQRLFPAVAVRMRIKDLGDLFPSNQVLAECFDMDNATEIQAQYELIAQEVQRLKTAEERSANILAQILYARMRIEQLKIPTLLELAQQYRSEGAAVAIFVNFTATLQTLAEQLHTKCLIHGQQSLEERQAAIDDFNADRSHFIIANIRSGGVGISLHDQHGNYPRVSIISPSWSAQDIIQALGRVHRAGGKSPVRQRLVYCARTVEQYICHNLLSKIQHIANLNDGDLGSYHIPGLTDDQEHQLQPLTPEELHQRRLQTAQERVDRLRLDLKEAEAALAAIQRGEEPPDRRLGADSNR